jgi:AbrB family looped-hinge helix DNA binding protein
MERESNIARIGEGGRIIIPAEYRRALGLKTGDDVILSLGNGELHILPRKEALRRAKAIVRRHIPEGVSLVDELIAERRAEAARDE